VKADDAIKATGNTALQRSASRINTGLFRLKDGGWI
jgi:hypothetical protein